MQEEALLTARKQHDVILLSPTGTGKTLAYLLPLIERLKQDVAGVQAMVIVPSRELALQIETVLKAMNLPWKAMSVYGGRAAMDEHRTMKGMNPSIIIGTPGRLNDHLAKGNIVSSSIATLVIDEFDKCLELGFQGEMQQVVEKLPAVHHRYLTSATDMDELPAFTAMHRAVKLNYLMGADGEDKVHTYIVYSDSKDKLHTLYKLLCTLDEGQAIVFCNHRESVDRVGNYLCEQKFFFEAYHGGMEQEVRERALYKFRCGSSNVLISTDLAARGLDIPEVRHIIHYHLPSSEEGYIHRTGRTARWNAEGSSYLILHGEERVPEYLPEDVADYSLPERVGRPAPPMWATLYIGKGKKDKINKVDIAGFLYKKGGLTREDVGPIDVHDYYAYVSVSRGKVRQLLTLISGEKIKGLKTRIEVAK
jgi:superfamily II DNA/RNA helicase